LPLAGLGRKLGRFVATETSLPIYDSRPAFAGRTRRRGASDDHAIGCTHLLITSASCGKNGSRLIAIKLADVEATLD